MLRPVADKIIIIRDEAPDMTDGGIVIPEQAKEPITRGKVMAVGPGVREPNKLADKLLEAWERHVKTHPEAGATDMEAVLHDVVSALRYRAPTVQPGDKVLFGKYTGNAARIKDEEGVEQDCVLCDEGEIYGVIEE